MPREARNRRWIVPAAVAALALLAAGCSSGGLAREYEYEENLYLDLDGSATLYVSASVPALAALRGLDLDVDPRARFDADAIRALYEGPGVDVAALSTSRRDSRRFVHLQLDADNLSSLTALAPLSWSWYGFEREGELFAFRQVVGAAASRPVGDVGWTGEELVAFRLHLPSRIESHHAPDGVERGNILTWEQRLSDRLRSAPLELQARIEAESILVNTLVLFGSTVVAALMALATIVWWIARPSRAG
ncbi:MAG: hypothetical protein FJW23_03715 [Acidimicrobiia bacterium]|nr:hypothetical protein [Acidimicrobiia bacterium]